MRDHTLLNDWLSESEVQEKFWSLVEPEDLWGCMYWTGRLESKGYGEFGTAPRRAFAHRISYYLTRGQWPLVGRHTCDTPRCVAPTHILNGTLTDNIRDRDLRGRTAKGSQGGMSKLTEPQVLDIVSLVEQGDLTYREIAGKFSVSYATVGHIMSGLTWSHVTGR